MLGLTWRIGVTMTSEQQQRQPSLAPLRTKYRSTGSASPLVDAGVALRVRTRPGDSAPTLSGAATKVKGTQAPKVAEAQSPDQRVSHDCRAAAPARPSDNVIPHDL